MNPLPAIIEPQDLEQELGNQDLIIVDLCKPETYVQAHIPGAIYVDYKQIISATPPVMGLLPDHDGLATIAAILGLANSKWVVAYDDEGGGKAARLLWTLNVMGFNNCALLNGGIHAWANEKHPLEQTVNQATSSNFIINKSLQPVAERTYILDNLDNNSVSLLDARSDAEFKGIKKFANKAGHIPGAINLDWLNFIDQNNSARLHPETELLSLLQQCGFEKSSTIITYCQTHHRSALSYWVLKSLGYGDVKGYPGSWSDWGNAADTPVE